MTNALVVADDLTGAMDTGHGFATRGRGVAVRLAGPESRDSSRGDRAADVLAVDTDTRDRPAAVAAATVADVVATRPAPLVYKKVDSTLRGNVVAEVDAAMAAMDADLGLVAPAFPATGRTTDGGEHRVDGTPLAEAGYGVGESDLRTVLAASRYPVWHLDRDTVARGSTAVREALAAVAGEDPVLVACDAVTDEDLRRIAAGGAALDATPLFVGSGGLATQVEVPGHPAEMGEPEPDGAESGSSGTGVLGVVGSVNERTLAQLDVVPDEMVVRLDPAAAVRDPESAGTSAAASLADRLAENGRAVVTAATGPEDVAAAQRAARSADVDAGDRIASALAAAAAATLDGSVAGLVLTGGDVARAVLSALDARELALTGEAVAAGVPVGRVLTGPAAGTRLVTKAGGFGDRRVILNCLDALSRD